MKPLILCYPKCGTCKKAEKWLKENQIEVESRDIAKDSPSLEEITLWHKMSGLPVAKLFNTSGLKYRELNVKDRIKSDSDADLLALLASDGMLVKRPILVLESKVLVGFKQESWEENLLQRENNALFVDKLSEKC